MCLLGSGKLDLTLFKYYQCNLCNRSIMILIDCAVLKFNTKVGLVLCTVKTETVKKDTILKYQLVNNLKIYAVWPSYKVASDSAIIPNVTTVG